MSLQYRQAPLSVRRPHFLNIFSETVWPIKVKFHMEPPWDGGTKVCSNGPGHMAKMAVIPIFGENLNLMVKIFFSGTKTPMTLKVGMQHRVLEYYEVYSNDDPELTLIYFVARSKLVCYAFAWEKGKTIDFSETVVVYDINGGRCG